MSQRPLAARFQLAAALLLLAMLVMAGASALSDSAKQSDKLVILSTTDVKGKTSPCG